jgi:hypothetical protein
MAGISAPTLYRWLDKGIPKHKEHLIHRLLPHLDTETTATPPTPPKSEAPQQPLTIAVPNNDAVLLLQVFITTKAV